MSTLPSFETYGDYSGKNYGAHALVFSVGALDVYFSYKTPVAYRSPGVGLRVRVNDWGPTTGKHLNWIDGGSKADRIPGEQFEAELAAASANSAVMTC